MRLSCLSAGLLAGLLAGATAFAQPAAPRSPDKPATAVLPPLPPPTGIDAFRRILALSPAEREAALAAYTPQDRQVLADKLREFDALPPGEREIRLRTLQLRWYLRPLLRLPASNRVERLAAIPPPDRELVEDRLQRWDRLSPEMQQEVLENEMAIRILVRPEPPPPDKTLPVPVAPQRQEHIEKAIARWNAYSPEKQKVIAARFQAFFDLDDREKTKALNLLSDGERRQMERTLRVFESLPREERDRCLDGFQKFAGLSPEERQHFLKNVERWQEMNPKDRQTWRILVNKLAAPLPPLPPGMRVSPRPPLPPLPVAVPVATNQ